MYINILVGDWSADGHGKTETETYTSNYAADDIEQFYSEAVEKLGFDITKYFDSYEDDTIEQSILDPVIDRLYEPLSKTALLVAATWDEDDTVYHLDPSIMIEIWTAMASFAGADLVKVTIQDIRIGGYGLFY